MSIRHSKVDGHIRKNASQNLSFRDFLLVTTSVNLDKMPSRKTVRMKRRRIWEVGKMLKKIPAEGSDNNYT